MATPSVMTTLAAWSDAARPIDPPVSSQSIASWVAVSLSVLDCLIVTALPA